MIKSDACIVASGSIEGRVRLWDVRRKGFFRTFGRKGGPSINSLAFSPDGRLLAIGDEDGLKLWDVNNDNSPGLKDLGKAIFRLRLFFNFCVSQIVLFND